MYVMPPSALGSPLTRSTQGAREACGGGVRQLSRGTRCEHSDVCFEDSVEQRVAEGPARSAFYFLCFIRDRLDDVERAAITSLIYA